MKKIILSLLFSALTLVPVSAHAKEAFVVDRFHSDILIHQDGHITVTENIDLKFTEKRHGIFRDIPSENIRLKVKSVTDGEGEPRPYVIESFYGGTRIRIGDANRYVEGRQVYRIKYDARGVIQPYETHDELYWNVTGNRWDTVIKSASANIRFDWQINNELNYRLSCFTGYYGSREQKCVMDFSSNAMSYITNNLTPREGLTAVAGFPKGKVTFPASITVSAEPRQFRIHFDDNIRFTCEKSCTLPDISPGEHTVAVSKWGFDKAELTQAYTSGEKVYHQFELEPNAVFYLIRALLAIVALVIIAEPVYRLLKYGRDPKFRGAIVPYYKPPKLSPAEVGTLVDEKAHLHDISASIVNLAVRGYLKIKELPDALGLIFKKDDYELVYTNKPKHGDPGLTLFEEKLIKHIFGSKKTKKISDLKNKFYTHLPKLKDHLYSSLVQKGYFKKSPDTVRAGYMIKAVILVFLAPFLLIAEYAFLGTVFSVALVINGILSFITASWMPRKTVAGKRMQEEILGLKMYMEVAEKDRIKFQEKENIFYELLPYAMALKVADKWSEAFEGLFDKPPEWYQGTHIGQFHPTAFTTHLESAAHQMATSFRSTPGSSGSGFSGGGFSGGGFGGGGGGSW